MLFGIVTILSAVNVAPVSELNIVHSWLKVRIWRKLSVLIATWNPNICLVLSAICPSLKRVSKMGMENGCIEIALFVKSARLHLKVRFDRSERLNRFDLGGQYAMFNGKPYDLDCYYMKANEASLAQPFNGLGDSAISPPPTAVRFWVPCYCWWIAGLEFS